MEKKHEGSELDWWKQICNGKDAKITKLEKEKKALEDQVYRLSLRINGQA